MASSFETHRFAMLLRMRSQTLMVRSAPCASRTMRPQEKRRFKRTGKRSRPADEACRPSHGGRHDPVPIRKRITKLEAGASPASFMCAEYKRQPERWKRLVDGAILRGSVCAHRQGELKRGTV